MNTVDNCDVTTENMEMEDDLVQAEINDSQGHLFLNTVWKVRKDRKFRVKGLDFIVTEILLYI